MRDNHKQAIINQLISMRAQIDSALFLLSEGDEPEAECTHPEDQRRSFTTMGGPVHWECKICDYVFKEEK